jgi:hypothetical protein
VLAVDVVVAVVEAVLAVVAVDDGCDVATDIANAACTSFV